MRSIDGQTLRQMLVSAANNLYNHYPEIDALNVFPVPDGDTGMNMNLTLASGSKEISNRSDDDVYMIASAFSKGLLMGARGNSGVITSQIFRGFADSLKGKNEITSTDLAEAFSNGSAVAYKAVMKPVEGTILTVIRESSNALLNYVNNNEVSLEKAMDYFLEEANASLNRTPELLPVLKEVGVVDSGGAGLCTIIYGMNQALKGNFIEKNQVEAVSEGPDKTALASFKEDDEFGYCTEFIMRLGPDSVKKVFNENRFKNWLLAQGNSLVVVRDDDIVKVHVHTLTPGHVLTYAQGYGEFIKLKIENMTEQHTNLTTKPEEPRKAATPNKPAEPKKDYGMVAISAGKGIDQLFFDVGVDKIVSGGQTMNPSIEDIVNAVRETNAKSVFVFPNNSNIIMAALQASDVLSDEVKVHVIATKTIPQGIVAASSFSPDLDDKENVKNMKDAIKHVKSGSVTYAIKDTVIDGVSVTKDYFMGISDKKIITCEKKPLTALYKLLSSMVNSETFLITILVGEDVKDDDIETIKTRLEKKYPEVELDIRRGDQPVYSFLVGVE